jgi:subtilisin-like proprotein convertase family protein
LEVALSINHGRPSDLRAVLTHIESGTSELLFEHPAVVPASVTTSNFGGQAIAGSWRLEIFDDQKNGTGTLDGWSLTATFAGQAGAFPEFVPQHLFMADGEPAELSTIESSSSNQLSFDSTGGVMTPTLSSKLQRKQPLRSLAVWGTDVRDDVLAGPEAWLDDGLVSELHRPATGDPHDFVFSIFGVMADRLRAD